jgi:hypothetical protein
MKKYTVALFIFLLLTTKTAMAYEYNLEPSLSLTGQYNDNIFLRHSDRIGDFITYASPGIAFSVKSLNTELKLGYSPTFSFYRSHDELNDTGHNFAANGTFTLSDRLIFVLTDTFVKSSDIRDLRDIPDLGPITQRAETTFHNLTGNASYKLTNNLFSTLGLSYSDADTEGIGFSKVKTYSGNMALAYNSSEKTTLSANAGYIKYNYNPGSDATGQDYTLGVTHKLSPTVTISVNGGVIITKIEDNGTSDVNFKGGVDIKKIFETGEADLSYKHTIISGIESNSPVRDQIVSFRLLMPVSKKWTPSVSAFYSDYKSVGTTKTDRNEAGFNTDLMYSFSPEVNLTLSYRYINSNDKIDNKAAYYNNIVFLTFRLSYSRRL